METRYVIFLAVLLLLLVNGCSAVDGKGNVDTNSGLDPESKGKAGSNEETGGSDSVTKSAEVDKVKEGKEDQRDKLKESVNIRKYDNSTTHNVQKSNENNSTKEMGSKEAENMQKSNGGTNEESRAKEGDNEKGKLSDETKSKDMPEEPGTTDDSKATTKKGTQDEKCDSSNKCMDDGKNFVACLRVPGNDSPALSLLIQSKVKSPLGVTISAPEHVQLKETDVHLKEEGHVELTFSVKKTGIDNVIMFIAKNGNCSLDFSDLIAHNWEEESDNTPKSTYFSFIRPKSTLVFISLTALLILAAGCMCASIRWKHFSNSSSTKYQRLDKELPVSGAPKLDSDADDGWENSWGDDWDDEEAPKTPLMPLTPSVSSKGLASRRLNKEGWKD